ncbi:MAG: ion transporter [Pseudomonadota bacterium]
MTPQPLENDTGLKTTREASPDGLTPLQAFVERAAFKQTITGLIFFNAIILGALTFTEHGTPWHDRLALIDEAVLMIFVLEIALKLAAWRRDFFRNGWRIFDFIVVFISLVPASSSLAIMRALRVLRIFRLLHVVPMMRRITEALFRALPGMSAILAVIALIIYVSAVIATDMFGRTDNEDVQMLFGDLHSSALSLFQVMTMDGWRNEVVQKVMDDGHPYAWVFFLIFIFVASFAVLNLFIALFVDALQAEHDAAQDEMMNELEDKAEDAEEERHQMLSLLQSLREEIVELRQAVEDQSNSPRDG